MRAVALGGAGQPFGDLVECRVPRDRLEGGAAHALVADPAQWLRQPVGVMLALGIARDLGADHTRRVGLAAGAVDPADAIAVDALDLERAGAGAVMRADAGQDVERQNRAPSVSHSI